MLIASPVKHHCHKTYSLKLSCADLFTLFSPAYEPQSWAPNYTYVKNIQICKLNIFIADSCKSKFTSNIIIGWVAVTAIVAAIDFAGTVAFGVDYDTIKVTQPEYPRHYTD